jgi:hypothetical protein
VQSRSQSLENLPSPTNTGQGTVAERNNTAKSPGLYRTMSLNHRPSPRTRLASVENRFSGSNRGEYSYEGFSLRLSRRAGAVNFFCMRIDFIYNKIFFYCFAIQDGSCENPLWIIYDQSTRKKDNYCYILACLCFIQIVVVYLNILNRPFSHSKHRCVD